VSCCSCRYDETICPTDFKEAGEIVDDELNDMLVKPLLPGVTLHALMDCCHSGTVLDLPYRAKAGLMGGKFEWKLKSRVVKGTAGGTAYQIGACKDSQTAADTNAMSGSAYTGAATFSFIDAIETHGTNQTYARWVREVGGEKGGWKFLFLKSSQLPVSCPSCVLACLLPGVPWRLLPLLIDHCHMCTASPPLLRVCSLLQHMMEALKKQGGTGGGAGALMGGLPMASTLGNLGSALGGGLTGMAAGAAAGMLANFVLGPGAMGGQIPVLCCDKQVDIYQQTLSI
jgi:hypothetical protein